MDRLKWIYQVTMAFQTGGDGQKHLTCFRIYSQEKEMSICLRRTGIRI